MEYYNSKFGPAMVQSMIPRMKAVAQEYGILMEYGGNVGNTLDSHVRKNIVIALSLFFIDEQIDLLYAP